MTTPQDMHTRVYTHINGSAADLLDRLAVSELCKGWPVYRDASEWKNFRSLFAPKALVWTTWSGACDVDKFIEISKAGKQKGVFIQHRECGTLVELGPVREGAGGAGADGPAADDNGGSGDGPVPDAAAVRRAVGKMKATITQRFADADGGAEYDVDCDCRFVFFCEKVAAQTTTQGKGTSGRGGGGGGDGDGDGDPVWRAVYVKLVYEKDRIVPADGHTAPQLTAEERAYMRDRLPEGYRYLGVMQRRLGYEIDEKLVTPRNDGWGQMYAAMEAWLAGKPVKL